MPGKCPLSIGNHRYGPQTGTGMFLRDDVSSSLPGGANSGFLFYPGGTGDLELFKDSPKVTQLVWDGKKGMSAFSRGTHGLHGSCPRVQ